MKNKIQSFFSPKHKRRGCKSIKGLHLGCETFTQRVLAKMAKYHCLTNMYRSTIVYETWVCETLDCCVTRVSQTRVP